MDGKHRMSNASQRQPTNDSNTLRGEAASSEREIEQERRKDKNPSVGTHYALNTMAVHPLGLLPNKVNISPLTNETRRCTLLSHSMAISWKQERVLNYIILRNRYTRYVCTCVHPTQSNRQRGKLQSRVEYHIMKFHFSAYNPECLRQEGLELFG